MTAPRPATPLPWSDTSQYFSAPEDFGCYTCAEDYEEAQRDHREVIEEEMP